MFVKPAANAAFDEKAEESKANPRVLAVFDPALQDYLPAYGRDVGTDNGLYWHRRVMQGDATELSAAEGNASLEAEFARQQAERKRLEAQAVKDKPAAVAGAKEGK